MSRSHSRPTTANAVVVEPSSCTPSSQSCTPSSQRKEGRHGEGASHPIRIEHFSCRTPSVVGYVGGRRHNAGKDKDSRSRRPAVHPG
jgi:hypothetical protein